MQRLVHREPRAVPSLSHCQAEGGLCLLGFPFYLLGQDSRTTDSGLQPWSCIRITCWALETNKCYTPRSNKSQLGASVQAVACCNSFPGASQGETRLSVSGLSGNFYDSLTFPSSPFPLSSSSFLQRSLFPHPPSPHFPTIKTFVTMAYFHKNTFILFLNTEKVCLNLQCSVSKHFPGWQ